MCWGSNLEIFTFNELFVKVSACVGVWVGGEGGGREIQRGVWMWMCVEGVCGCGCGCEEIGGKSC